MKSEPIRVLQVFICMDRSGVPVMLMNYYRNIDRSKVQFDFAVDSAIEACFDREIESLGGRIFRIGKSDNSPGYYVKLARIIRKNGYDFIHCHKNFKNMPVLITALFSGVKNRISHSHNTYQMRGLKSVFSGLIRLINRKMANVYLACSVQAGICLYGKGLHDSGKIRVINNAMDLSRFEFNEKTRAEVRTSMSIDDKIVIGHVGNFVLAKNHVFLMDIFREIHRRNKKTVMLLAGGGRFMEEIKRRVTDFGLNDDVVFLGSRDDVNRLYQAFDIMVYPSLNEGLAFVLLEAQASGLPILMSDVIPDEANATGMIEKLSLSKSAGTWAEKAMEVLKNSKKRESKVRELAEKGFNIYKEAKKLEDLYLRLKG